MGEHRVRELNDEINKLNKTKSYWDSRIIELGGGDQGKGRKFYDVEGNYLFFKYLLLSLFSLSSTYEVFKIYEIKSSFFHFHVLFDIYSYTCILFLIRVHTFFVSLLFTFSAIILCVSINILSVTFLSNISFLLKVRSSPVHQDINIMEQRRTFLGSENFFKKKTMRVN